MTAVVASERFRQPVVRRLGFEDGWWIFSPRFLKLGLPLVLVDECLLPKSAAARLEVFGARRPAAPVSNSGLRTEWQGNGIQLYDTQQDSRTLASHWFRTLGLPIPAATAAPLVLLVVGDSYSLQES